MTNADTIISGLGGNPYNGMCRCPAHDDKNPSLHVSTGNDGKVLVHCFAGCTPEAVIAALKNRGLWPQRSPTSRPMNLEDEDMETDQPDEKERRSLDARDRILNTASKEVHDAANPDHAEWLAPYLEGRGLTAKAPPSLLYLSLEGSRWLQKYIPKFPPYPAMVAPLINRDFRLQGVLVTFLTRDGRNNLRSPKTGKSIRRIYGRAKGGFVALGSFDDPEQPLLVASEGIEKALAAKALIGPRCPAIAVPGGNFVSVTPPDYPKIIIAADNDRPGFEKAEKGADLWATQKHSVSIAAPTEHKDWDEALRDPNANHKALRDVLLKGEPVQPGASQIGAVSAKDFMEISFPPREYLLAPWLTTGSLSMIHAFRGNYKTWLGLGVAHAVAAGNDLLGWKAGRPARVLYVDGELSGDQLQNRLRAFGQTSKNLFILTRHLLFVHGLQLPDLGTPQGRTFLDRIIEREQIELIILDSLSTLITSGVENEGESWVPLIPWQLKHRYNQRSILYLHHEGRTTNAPRGTSRREDAADTMIGLRGSPDEATDQESAFELRFTKHRDFAGADAAAKLVHFSMQDGLVQWRYEAAKASKRERVEVLLQQGELSQGEIAKRIGVDKSYVSKIKDQQPGKSNMTGLTR